MMTTDSWIVNSIGDNKIRIAMTEADRRRLHGALGIEKHTQLADERLRFIAKAFELRVFDLLNGENPNDLSTAAAEAFQVARVLPRSKSPIEAGVELVRLGCLGVLGDRGADVKRLLSEEFPGLPIDADDWGLRVWASILDVWLRLLRKKGWDDLDAVQERVANLRSYQLEKEPRFLKEAERRQDAGTAWELVFSYHLARAAEILGTYQSQGMVDGHYDVREQLDAQFDRAITVASRVQLMEQETFARLLARMSRTLVDNSIWTVTRAVNSRVTRFVESMLSRERRQPIFEMLPPQRRTLREKGLLGPVHRAVVVSLPTSSGKTFIAQFRILQALNQFNSERGWVAYLAPTRALVNQLTVRLRRDFANIGITVEKASPALEVDGLEADVLAETDVGQQFRLLVTTPEKLDLMLRGDWERKIGRPLTLVVVDEAHGLASDVRGLRLELLLATINRECRHAQFLLLTPFVPNAVEIARWLAPDSNTSIDLGVEWTPNDRVIAIARPKKGDVRGDFRLELLPLHTTRKTIEVPETLEIGDKRPLGLSWSTVSQSPGKLAAATAHVLQRRGTVIVLTDKPKNSWGIAKALKVQENRITDKGETLKHVQRFLDDEMGSDFPLTSLLDYGIGVHHAGLSEDTRTIVEWLTEQGKLQFLVATTTIAQGVNFPVSGVVFASHQYPYGQDMSPEDFWNVAGRAGRVDQGDLGVIALAGHNDTKVDKIKEFVSRSVGNLNSTLIDMVQKVDADANVDLHSLERLYREPGWSAFLQYLAHTYRQIGDHEKFATEIEQVLRGTFGFQNLRKSHKGWADQLVNGVYSYAQHIKGKPLKLVDATGFSWESVNRTLMLLSREDLKNVVWSSDLFGTRQKDLQRMVGVLLEVPELSESLRSVTGEQYSDGDVIARIICDWVQERPLSEMAIEYFSKKSSGNSEESGGDDRITAMTRCCRSIFGRLAQTASWGLSALQSLTVGDSFDSLSVDEQRTLRNMPARVYYGVNSDEAIALRLLGVPRTAATPLARELGVDAAEPLYSVRTKIKNADIGIWRAALGDRGTSYHRVWSIIEGNL